MLLLLPPSNGRIGEDDSLPLPTQKQDKRAEPVERPAVGLFLSPSTVALSRKNTVLLAIKRSLEPRDAEESVIDA